jgi:hypothetical protein
MLVAYGCKKGPDATGSGSGSATLLLLILLKALVSQLSSDKIEIWEICASFSADY